MSAENQLDLEVVKQFLSTEQGSALINEVKQPLLQKNTELLSELSQLKELKKFVTDLGGVDGIKQALEGKKKEEVQLAEKDKNFEALKAHLEAELQKKEQGMESFKSKFVETRLDSLLTSTIAENKGVPELLKPLLKDRVKATLGESDVEVTVLDSNGQQMFKDGKPATVKDLLESMKQDKVYARLFEGSGSSGSGARGSSGDTSGTVITDPKAPGYSLTKHMAYLKSMGKA